jgi:hypothetical protein
VVASLLVEAGLDIGVAAKSLSVALPVWAAARVMAVVIFIGAGDLGLSAKNSIHRASPPVPENTVKSVKRDVATVQERSKR